MFLDFEKNIIRPTRQINGHTLTIGTTGYGKTYGLCRQIEDAIAGGEFVIILNTTGSFAQEELVKLNFKYQGVRTNTEDIVLPLGGKFVSNLESILADSFSISSYTQKALLHDLLTCSGDELTFESIIEYLVEMLEQRDGKTDKENIGNLLNKFDEFEKMNIRFRKNEIGSQLVRPCLQILDFNDLSSNVSGILAQLLLNFFWILAKKGTLGNTAIVIDELQWLKNKGDSIMGDILREGRKYGVSLFLATQFLYGTFENESKGLLDMCATKFIFHPNSTDLRWLLENFPQDEKNIWRTIFNGLGVGRCVIDGECSANNGTRAFKSRVIVDVVANP